MILSYYISTALISVILLFSIAWVFFHGRNLSEGSLELRRKSFFTFFSLYLASTLSRLFIVRDNQLEFMPTLTVCIDYCCFAAFSMLGAAYFGRKHYQNPYNWFFLMQIPVVLIILNIMTRMTGYYHPIFSLNDIIVPQAADKRIIFMGRIAFVILIVLSYLFLIIMLIEAYLHYRRHTNDKIPDMESEQNLHEHGNIVLYVGILLFTVISDFIGFAPFQILANIVMSTMLVWSMTVYTRFVKFTQMKEQGSYTAAVIEDQLKKIIYQERNNPLYVSNASLEDVADALQVSRTELSDYIYNELGTSFSAWVSEKKLLFCAHLLRTTDRMISEIALTTGYKNVPAMNKAFKAFYGETPSEYRKSKTRL